MAVKKNRNYSDGETPRYIVSFLLFVAVIAFMIVNGKSCNKAVQEAVDQAIQQKECQKGK